MNTKRDLGFTLVELMITIAVVGVVSSLAVPSFQRVIERNVLRDAAAALKSDLLFARTEAIKRSQNVIVSRTIGNNGTWCYGLTLTVAGCDCTTVGSCEIKTVTGIDSFNMTNMRSVANQNATFQFRRGTAAAIADNTCFSTTNYTVKVQTSRLGRTTICTNNNANALIGAATCPVADAVCAL